MRLVGGATSEGRIEVFHNGEWGTVCDNGWGLPDGDVICRQLGFARASRVVGGAWYGQGVGPGKV